MSSEQIQINGIKFDASSELNINNNSLPARSSSTSSEECCTLELSERGALPSSAVPSAVLHFGALPVGALLEVEQQCSGQLTSTESALREELLNAYKALKKKDDECKKLTSDQLQTGVEVEELTASLFEEANKMVQDANIKRMAAEKLLKEAVTKIDVLVAEVTALKTMVMTSTPSMPNPHLNPQIDKAMKQEFSRGHKRSTSHHSLDKLVSGGGAGGGTQADFFQRQDSGLAKKPSVVVDPNFMELFRQWRQNPILDSSSLFLERIKLDDIIPCLHFNNEQSSRRLYEGIVSNTLTIEPLVVKDDKASAEQRCALSDCRVICKYCIRLGDGQDSYSVSQASRNRVSAVCDLTTYIRYIAQGLVKSSEEDMYAEIMSLRKKMCLARLGLEE